MAHVGDGGTFGAKTPPSRRSIGLRWIVAIVGVILVAAVSIAVVSLVGARPASSVGMGYMPRNLVVYSEARFDLPGDQREKVAAFLKPFPGFNDSSQFDTKLDELYDHVVRYATHDEASWTTDIAPWFGGQVSFGTILPDPADQALGSSSGGGVFVATIRDRAKAIAWVTKIADDASLNRTTYGDADLLVSADQGGSFAIAVNDKVMIGGTTAAVKASVDTAGNGPFAEDETIKAALVHVQKDYVALTVTNIKAYADMAVRMASLNDPAALARTQIDDLVLGLVPPWMVSSARFENDALVSSSVMPSVAIGHDATNRADEVVGHVPAKTIAFFSVHDAGESLSALVAKFRELPETQPAFQQVDRVLNLIGGFDGVFGWWGDAAFVVSPLDDGTIGAGLVIKPRKPDDAARLVASLNSFVQIGGASAGATSRTVDHNGTTVTIIDLSQSPSMASTKLPAGYKAEIALAANADIAVLGYGESFVNAVLDAKGPTSLAGDARFQGLSGRVGAENIGLSFVDLSAIRKLIEPLAQAGAPADVWAFYAKEIQPYLAPLDAVVSAVRKDGSVDRAGSQLTAH